MNVTAMKLDFFQVHYTGCSNTKSSAVLGDVIFKIGNEFLIMF